MEAAQEKAAEYGVQAVTVDRLLADPDIQIVINLTVPLAHAPVSLQVVEAAKHVYSEKPLVIRHAEAEALMLAAAAKGVRVGCAPDTFLGAGHQACRRAIDAGLIGRPIAGSAFFATHGMEHWHPNPEFFFKRGGGPMLDIGPYYVTQLVNLSRPGGTRRGAGHNRQRYPHRQQRAAEGFNHKRRGSHHRQRRVVLRQRRQRDHHNVLGRLETPPSAL